jgi:hypothetical protein
VARPNFSRRSATDHLFWTKSFHFIKYISRLQQFLIFIRCEKGLYSLLPHKHEEETGLLLTSIKYTSFCWWNEALSSLLAHLTV